MPSSERRYAFECYPRRPLTPRVDRRALLGTLATELAVSKGRSRGGVAFRLADLGVAADEELAGIRPRVIDGCLIGDNDGYSCAVVAGSGRRIRLWPIGHPASQALAAFDGTATIADVAAAVAAHTTWDTTAAFAYTRGVFLHLVTAGICMPS